ncbi:MAG: hypothetical protein C5B50_25360 [Verrucomicrobia bacterium]|nr:MAG: hypothetical protein C5B50_25360 [Verrucomicrobiota bacterium]
MKTLDHPSRIQIQAAQGWLELGNPVEAEAELEQMTPELREHPDVLKLRWEICAARKKWEEALEIASALVHLEPDEPLGWVHKSFALHELKRTTEARNNLVGVVEKFGDSPTIRYNMACYECQLGRLEQAKLWLEKAFKMGNPVRMKQAALKDPDLEPLWVEIRKYF